MNCPGPALPGAAAGPIPERLGLGYNGCQNVPHGGARVAGCPMVGRLGMALCRWISANVWELLTFTGLGLVAGGLGWWLHPAAALITGGLGLLILGLFGAHVHGTSD